jgi:hypothetical protein
MSNHLQGVQAAVYVSIANKRVTLECRQQSYVNIAWTKWSQECGGSYCM